MLLGAYLYMHNHWCLVAVDMKEQVFTFVDPKCPRDAELLRGTQCLSNWKVYMGMRKMESLQRNSATYFTLRIPRHAQQPTMDCGIFTLTVSTMHMHNHNS